MSTETSAAPKPKKSVALSGVPAGNTALCTVGRTGNDLHYRGYDILHFADTAEFEEIAYLLIYGKLPTQAELTNYKTKLKAMRGLPAAVQDAFLSAFKSLDRFDGRSQLTTWLHRITVNACLMKLRSKSRRPETSIDGLLPTFVEDGHQTHSTPKWNADPSSGIQQAELRTLRRLAIGHELIGQRRRNPPVLLDHAAHRRARAPGFRGNVVLHDGGE